MLREKLTDMEHELLARKEVVEAANEAIVIKVGTWIFQKGNILFPGPLFWRHGLKHRFSPLRLPNSYGAEKVGREIILV